MKINGWTASIDEKKAKNIEAAIGKYLVQITKEDFPHEEDIVSVRLKEPFKVDVLPKDAGMDPKLDRVIRKLKEVLDSENYPEHSRVEKTSTGFAVHGKPKFLIQQMRYKDTKRWDECTISEAVSL